MGSQVGERAAVRRHVRWAGLALALACATDAGAVCNFVTNKVQSLVGTTLTYQLTFTNNTGSGMRGLYVSDTISPVLTNVTSAAPAQFGTATLYQTASGTLYTWSYDLGGSGP